MNAGDVSIRFVIGSRKIAEMRRPLQTVAFGLSQLVAGTAACLPELEDGREGYRVHSVPRAMLPAIVADHPGFVMGGLHVYRRFYIDMAGTYEGYLGRFSSRARSTLNRKRRKIQDLGGGTLDVREYRTPDELDQFLVDAMPLSRKTYQARLLDAGLPEDEAFVDEMRALAGADRLRAYLLFLNDAPVSYLFLPVIDNVVTYAFLGYDPDRANLSAGTVLQMEALRRLFAEERYTYFDFTEGEGAHKQLFGTDFVDACSFFLLKRTLSSRLLLGALAVFDRSVAAGKTLAQRNGALARMRRFLRA
ncbi:GNAT family N-acetyltransferase [Novosphingobium sp. ZN18A2]|uniref:GNAT family N-acetyltransferase n=1 Tax=Novosphingobium sp. ZN18A2 TaxID=3079861 RepID=UPI0030D346C6